MMSRRGWIETIWNDHDQAWEVYDWSEHYDSGARLDTFDDKQEAVAFAQAQAIKLNRKFFCEVEA